MLGQVGLRIPEEVRTQLRFGRGLDNRRLKQSGYRFQLTTRETVQAYAEALRLAPLRESAGAPYRYEREVEEFLRWSPERAERGRFVTLLTRQRSCRGSRSVRAGSYHSPDRMRTRLIVLAAFVATLALGGVAAAYTYDHSKRDVIAQGVKVNGVPIGGLSAAAAAAKLRGALLDPLAKPVTVRYKHRRFTLTPKQAAVGIDIHGTVSQALARSREGNMFSRAWRNLRGQALNAGLAADVVVLPAGDPAAGQARAAQAQPPVARREARPLGRASSAPTHSQVGVRVKFNTLRQGPPAHAAGPGREQDRARSTPRRSSRRSPTASSPRSIRRSSSSTGARSG